MIGWSRENDDMSRGTQAEAVRRPPLTTEKLIDDADRGTIDDRDDAEPSPALLAAGRRHAAAREHQPDRASRPDGKRVRAKRSA
jgi:hypothetical protein